MVLLTKLPFSNLLSTPERLIGGGNPQKGGGGQLPVLKQVSVMLPFLKNFGEELLIELQ